MLKQQQPQPGFVITHIETCDFDQLTPINNQQVLEGAGKSGARIEQFIEREMGIVQRYHCPISMDAEDLAHSALQRLLEKSPELRSQAEFLIVAGISNPRPVTTLSTLLAETFELPNVSCWDLKSGCSTGVLALIQGLSWLNMGARCGIIVAAENLSRFSPSDALQMRAAAGDGAVAFSIEPSTHWTVKSVIHGTDARFAQNIKMRGRFPVNLEFYQATDYLYELNEKGNTLEHLQHYWLHSLSELLTAGKVAPEEVNHHITHQVDGSKNVALAKAGGIREEAIARNFSHFGNMGSPTVFINYYHWVNRAEHRFHPGDHLVIQAVGGGISWAGLCLQYVGSSAE